MALLIPIDQFPRNASRGTAHMYSTDFLAGHWAQAGLSTGHMETVGPELQLFFCSPFAHSEDLNDQEMSVALNTRLGQPWLDHAKDAMTLFAVLAVFHTAIACWDARPRMKTRRSLTEVVLTDDFPMRVRGSRHVEVNGCNGQT